MAALWRDLLTSVPDTASVLVVGHSGELESALVACLPGADRASWGAAFGPCEGARLTNGGDPARFHSVEFLRTDAALGSSPGTTLTVPASTR